MDITKKAAEVLVECGTLEAHREGIGFFIKCSPSHKRLIKWAETEKLDRFIEPLHDSLEGRRQADAIEDWLKGKNKELWERSVFVHYSGRNHQWRLDRIKWCLEELSK